MKKINRKNILLKKEIKNAKENVFTYKSNFKT